MSRTAKPGFLVAVNAPSSAVRPETLWVNSGRLYEGPNPFAAVEYKSYDMMLFELHRGPSRTSTWATLPPLASHANAFDVALRETASQELGRKINDLYHRFELDLRKIDELTDPDKAAIRGLVASELRNRVLDVMSVPRARQRWRVTRGAPPPEFR
jgi:hypothetical protein